MKQKKEGISYGMLFGLITILGAIGMVINYWPDFNPDSILTFTNILLMVIICELIWIREDRR